MTNLGFKRGVAVAAFASAILVGPLALVPAAAQMYQAPTPTQRPDMNMQMQQMGGMRGTAYQIPVEKVKDAKQTLANASIVDKDGNSVGSVRDVQTDSNGQASAIKADVGGFLGVGSKIVVLDPTRMKYERDRNVLITNMTKDEIKALPQTSA